MKVLTLGEESRPSGNKHGGRGSKKTVKKKRGLKMGLPTIVVEKEDSP